LLPNQQSHQRAHLSQEEAMTSRPTAALCAIMKNEGPYILEWVALHRLIGFNEVFIYDNDSSDNTPDLLARLDAAGVLKAIAWPSVVGVAPQRAAYADVLPRVKSEWVCFIDADEFINLKQNNTIQAFLHRFPGEVSAVAMNWRVFGSSGQMAFGPDLVIRRFTHCSRHEAQVNRHCKTIARVDAIGEMHIHRCFLKRGLYVDESGQSVEIERMGLTPAPRTDIVQVNHYVVKSQEEFELKRLRGNANRALDEADKFQRLDRNFFAIHDLGDEIDLSIQRFDSRLNDELKWLAGLVQD
jgi:Glycosyltransferase family 92